MSQQIDLARIKNIQMGSDDPIAKAFEALAPTIKAVMLERGVTVTLSAIFTHLSLMAEQMPRFRPGMKATMQNLIGLIDKPELFERIRAANRGPRQ